MGDFSWSYWKEKANKTASTVRTSWLPFASLEALRHKKGEINKKLVSRALDLEVLEENIGTEEVDSFFDDIGLIIWMTTGKKQKER